MAPGGSLTEPRPQVPLLRSLEGLRLISSIGIIWIHMLPHVGLPATAGFDLFVDLFFVISGIVIGNLYVGAIGGWGDYATFLRRRLARVYPLHLATLLFYIALGFAVARAHIPIDDPGRFDPGQIVPNALLVHAWFGDGRLSFNFVSWSISAEFAAYLLFPIVAVIVARRGGLIGVSLILAACLLLAEGAIGEPLYALHWSYAPVRALPSFAFGVWLSSSGAMLARRVGSRATGLTFAAASLAYLAYLASGWTGYPLLCLIWLLVAAAYLCDLKGLTTYASWRPLSARGHLTYSIYMLHLPVTTVFLSFLFPRLFGHSAAAQGVSVVLSLAILFALAEASFRWFENPLRRWLR